MSDEFSDYILDLLGPLGGIESGRFFGGTGFKCDGIQFAMVMRETLYLVVDDTTRPKYVDAGSRPFCYEKKGGVQEVRRYYEVPEDVLESPDALREWAGESIETAKRTR